MVQILIHLCLFFIVVQLVIDPVRREGVVLVTSNNPYLGRWPRSAALCPDRCLELGWDTQLNSRHKVQLNCLRSDYVIVGLRKRSQA
jgi:hypothetical protein